MVLCCYFDQFLCIETHVKKLPKGGTWPAQLVESLALDLGAMSLSPSLGVEITLKKNKKQNLKKRLLTVIVFKRKTG